jgi:two-component system response regulator FixJ
MNAASASACDDHQRRGFSVADLSARERDVLGGIVRGLTNKEIGIELGISHRTVEIHRARLMRKLEVTTLAALIAVAIAERDQLREAERTRVA